MSKEISKEVAVLATRLLKYPQDARQIEIKTLAASCLAQREDDPGKHYDPDDIAPGRSYHDPGGYPASAEAGYEPINLRDYFAGQALNGYSSDPEQPFHENYAKWAYETADAMLKEREGGE